MIEVHVTNTFMLNEGNEFIILLKEIDGERALPISIGQSEAQAIAIKLNNISTPRPLTHDLFKSVLDALSCSLERIEITELMENTFYAKILLEMKETKFVIDSRPSDAIALALRFGSPIFVDEKILAEAGVVISETVKDQQDNLMKKPETAEHSPLDILKKKLSRAISEERYEDAARLRDEITGMTKSN